MIRTPTKTRAKRDSQERERTREVGIRRERESVESEESYMEALRMSPDTLPAPKEPQISVSVPVKKKIKLVNKEPIVLPATAADVKDLDTLDRTITSLVTAICVAISDGKCVTSRNKLIVASAATEIKRSLDTYIFDSVNTNTVTQTPTTDTTTTNTKNNNSSNTLNIDFKEEFKLFTENIQDKIAECVKKEIATFKHDLDSSYIKTQQLEPTYAQVIATKSQMKPKSRPSIIVTPKVASTTKSYLINEWQKGVSFTHTNFAPNKVIPISNNKLIVEFENTQHRDETIKKLETSETLNAQLPVKLKPMLILKGINKHIDKNELINIIYNQNPEIKENSTDKEDLKLKFTTQNKNLAL